MARWSPESRSLVFRTVTGFLVFVGLCISQPIQAQLVFEPSTVKIGEIKSGPVYAQTVVMRNVGSLPIEIVEVRRGCNCIEPRLSTKRLMPSEKGLVTLALRSLGQAEGERTWRCYFVYRAGQEAQEAVLTLQGQLRNEITVSPALLAIDVVRKVRQEITISDRRSTPLKVTSVEVSNPGVKATFEQTSTMESKVRLEVAADALTASREEATLTVNTNDSFYRQLVVPLILVKGSDVQVQAHPSRVVVNENRPSTLIRLRGRDAMPVLVESAKCAIPGAKVTWANSPEHGTTLRLIFTAPVSMQGPLPCIEVQCSEPAGCRLTIPLTREEF